MELKRSEYMNEINQAKLDAAFVAELVQAVHPKRQVREKREMTSQVLMVLAEEAPDRIVPFIKDFYQSLADKNAFSKMVSLYCITGLVLAEREPQFSDRIDQFLAMLEDDSVMIASHCALNAGRIAKKYPVYEPNITARFLNVKDLPHKQKGLITAYVIEAFEGFAKKSVRLDEINAFVWQQLENQSPKARQAAQNFLAHAGISTV